MTEPVSKEFLELLNQAIEVEKEGYKLYLDTAKKMENILMQKTFEALAEDESKHIKALTEFYDNKCTTMSCPLVRELYNKSHNEARDAILSKPLQDINKLNVEDELIKAYEIAMKMEEEGYKFYEVMLDNAKSDDEKELLHFLLKEEDAHYKLLVETKEYLENPGDWFNQDEQPIVEG